MNSPSELPQEPLAKTAFTAGISIIVPTYKEAKNIPLLLERLNTLRSKHELTLEVLFMDDDSADGSVEAVAAAGFDWAKIITRSENHGLSQAVLDGFRKAQYPILVCMDCDLSHPPEQIPSLVLALSSGQQFVIGSRYVPGASTDDDWGFFRWLNSRVATLLARPLTSVRDPMSGFFALRKSDFDSARDLNPVGYKVALELVTKCDFDNVGEIPIHFSDRVHGESKLTLHEQLKYIQHIRRLYIYKFSNAMHLAQFLVVGASGVVVNLVILSLFNWMGFLPVVCLIAGIVVSLCTNFLLNRRFTFSYAKDRPIGRQFLGFLSASSFGMVTNFSVAYLMLRYVLPANTFSLQLAALSGIAFGTILNYLGSRYIVFRKNYIRRE